MRRNCMTTKTAQNRYCNMEIKKKDLMRWVFMHIQKEKYGRHLMETHLMETCYTGVR